MNIHDIFLFPGAPVIEAMKIIEKSSQRIALVVTPDFRLLGTVTDGDIRRGLICNFSTSDPVEKIMNSSPAFLPHNSSVELIEKTLGARKIAQLPLVDADGKVVDVVLSQNLKRISQKENTVIIMAGGLGTRLGELTADCPKPMLRINDKPILEIVIENLKEHGFSNFLIAVRYKAEIIENYFKDGSEFGVNIRYLREKERLGTAGALSLVERDDKHPLIVMNGDVLTKVNFSQMLDEHTKNRSMVSVCVRRYDYQIPFGVVKVNDHIVTDIEEKPTQSYLVSAGIYVLNPEILKTVPEHTYMDMPDLIRNTLSKFDKQVGIFPIHEYWIDVGRRDDLQQAQSDYQKGF